MAPSSSQRVSVEVDRGATMMRAALSTAPTIRAPRIQCQDFNSPHQTRVSRGVRAFSPVIMRKIFLGGVSVDESRGVF
jgi:hypothetical protein